MGPGGTRTKFPIKPKTKLFVKWKTKEGFGPLGSGCIVLGLDMAKHSGLGKPSGPVESCTTDGSTAAPQPWLGEYSCRSFYLWVGTGQFYSWWSCWFVHSSCLVHCSSTSEKGGWEERNCFVYFGLDGGNWQLVYDPTLHRDMDLFNGEEAFLCTPPKVPIPLLFREILVTQV